MRILQVNGEEPTAQEPTGVQYFDRFQLQVRTPTTLTGGQSLSSGRSMMRPKSRFKRLFVSCLREVNLRCNSIKNPKRHIM